MVIPDEVPPLLAALLPRNPLKVKDYDENYWNEFADTLANTAHSSNDTVALRVDDYTSSYDIHFVYNDIVYKSNLQRLLKQHYYSTYLLTCRSCYDHKEDLMHLILCSKRCSATHQILQSYQNYLFSKLKEACELIKVDPTPSLAKLSSLSCWKFSPSNWPSYALIHGCLPKIFVDLFVNLSILRSSAMKVVAAIHNHFIH
ncbi:hypothetical protein RclHR1_37810001 [Rhizophagus clarus]|uniref:Uncharacterized protein n=1 Tax=Rhizophagus clarus TaxID=94130 RepID=A0A2Z6S7K5_9GLOM|nr:hypothetical protein RclHR1_37810001 [Rhizophagus clarus]